MKAIKIKITGYIRNDYPGLWECKFVDAWSKEHTIHDKIAIAMGKDWDEKTEYPQDGVIACEILKKWIDETGRTILTVTTERPWVVETLEGLMEFDLLEEQLTEYM